MADKVVGVKLEADTSGAVNNVKNFKQELKLAQQEVVTLSEKFGATSKEAAAATQRAAGLKDAIGDAASLVDAFNPDTKFRAFGASINTVVGGFTALQGVLGLVGVESEETQKALLKVQSALAISQGFAQLQEGVQTFKNLGAVIQSTTLFQKANAIATTLAAGAMRLLGINTTTTSTAMNVLKGAIIATGIGALVVLLGVAADAMGLFSSGSDDAAESQEKLKKQIEGVNDSLSIQSNFLANEEKLEVAKAKRRGATEAEVFEIQQKYRRLNYNATASAYEEVRGLDEIEGAKLLQQLKNQNVAGQAAQIDFETKEIERRKEAAKKLADLAKEARKKQLEELIKDQERQGLIELGKVGKGISIETPKTPEQIQLEADIAARAENRKDLEAYIKYSTDSYAQFTEIHKRNVEERINNDKAEYVSRVELADASINAIGALSGLIGKQTAAGKIVALAEIAAGTAVGFIQALDIAQKSAKGTGPAAAFAFPIFYATQIAAVLGAASKAKGLLSGGGSGGGSSVSTNVPSSVSAPLEPQKAQQGTTTLDQNSLNAIGSATTRAFVLESDVTNNQERVTRLNRAARLGG